MRIVTNVKLTSELQVSPSPLNVQCVIRTRVIFNVHRRDMAFNDFRYNFNNFIPLSNRRVDANRGSICRVNIEFMFQLIVQARVAIGGSFNAIRIASSLYVSLFRHYLSFEFNVQVNQFDVRQCAGDVLVFRVNRLVVLYRVGVARDACNGYLSLNVPRLEYVVISNDLGEGNHVAIIGNLVRRVPNRDNASIKERRRIVRLVEEVGPVRETQGRIINRRIIRTRRDAVTSINVDNAVFRRVMPHAIGSTFNVQECECRTKVCNVYQLVIRRITTTAPRRRGRRRGRGKGLAFESLVSKNVARKDLSPALYPGGEEEESVSIVIGSCYSRVVYCFVLCCVYCV